MAPRDSGTRARWWQLASRHMYVSHVPPADRPASARRSSSPRSATASGSSTRFDGFVDLQVWQSDRDAGELIMVSPLATASALHGLHAQPRAPGLPRPDRPRPGRGDQARAPRAPAHLRGRGGVSAARGPPRRRGRPPPRAADARRTAPGRPRAARAEVCARYFARTPTTSSATATSRRRGACTTTSTCSTGPFGTRGPRLARASRSAGWRGSSRRATSRSTASRATSTSPPRSSRARGRRRRGRHGAHARGGDGPLARDVPLSRAPGARRSGRACPCAAGRPPTRAAPRLGRRGGRRRRGRPAGSRRGGPCSR